MVDKNYRPSHSFLFPLWQWIYGRQIKPRSLGPKMPELMQIEAVKCNVYALTRKNTNIVMIVQVAEHFYAQKAVFHACAVL